MSSKRAAENLSFAIIKGTLALLAKSGSATLGQIEVKIIGGLLPKERRELKVKGEQREIRRIVYYLNQRGYINRAGGRGSNAEFTITTPGYRRLEDFKMEPLKTGNWDGKWRVLTFDIPEENRAARDAVRSLIKRLGFVQLHKSVWVQPWPCRDQITNIQKGYGIQNHITYMEVATFDQERRFRRVFFH